MTYPTRCTGDVCHQVRSQHSGSSTGTAGTGSVLPEGELWVSTAGPAAAAWTRSSRPGHKALNGPNTSPVTSTRSHPCSPGVGRRCADGPLWHQSLRTVAAPGVHQRQPSPAAAARATASSAAAAISTVRGGGSRPVCAVPSAAYARPDAPTACHAALKPADAAASAWARAPVTMNAWATSTSKSTTSAGHRIKNGNTSPRSSSPRRHPGSTTGRWRASRRASLPAALAARSCPTPERACSATKPAPAALTGRSGERCSP